VSRHRRADEELYHGWHACLAVFTHRPEAIVRVYFTSPLRHRLADLIAFCSQSRRGYRLVDAENLDRIAGTRHHEGIAILARTTARWSIRELLDAAEAGRLKGPVLYLDGVANPHNLGSILRTAAHFGVSAITGRSGELPAVAAATARVAEGAAEIVPMYDLAQPLEDLTKLRSHGFRIIASSSHRGIPLPAAGMKRRCVIVLGGEADGVSRTLERVADACVCIPGSGAVESLNVGVAAGILLAEACRESPPGQRCAASESRR
jgi:TrmH RNA methyltransferase